MLAQEALSLLSGFTRAHHSLESWLLGMVVMLPIYLLVQLRATKLDSTMLWASMLVVRIVVANTNPRLSRNRWIRWPLPPYPSEAARRWGVIMAEGTACSAHQDTAGNDRRPCAPRRMMRVTWCRPRWREWTTSGYG